MLNVLRQINSFEFNSILNETPSQKEAFLNRPRPLTDDEIERFVNIIPDIPPYENVAFFEIGRIIQNGLRSRLRYQLRRQEVNPLAFDDLEKEIQRQYFDSVIRAGRAVGLDSGGAFGQLMTQSTLNTFHTTGVSSNVTGGIKGFQELINAKPVRSWESSTVHFRDNTLNLRGILELRDEIAHLTVGRADIEKPPDYLVENIEPIEPPDPSNPEYPYWYALYLALHPQVQIKSFWALRLTLRLDRMYARGITMEELCRAIETGCPPTVYCIPSPLNIGYIDIYPIDSNIEETSAMTSVADRELAFLSVTVAASLSEITMRGIPGITDITPTYLKVWATVLNEQYLDDAELRIVDADEPESKRKFFLRYKWRLTIDNRVFRTSSMTTDNIVRLANAVGIRVDKIEDSDDIFGKMIISMPEVEVDPLNDIDSMSSNLIKIGRLNEDEVALFNHLMNAMSRDYSFERGQWLIPVNDEYLRNNNISTNSILQFLAKLDIKSRIVMHPETYKFYITMSLAPNIGPGQLVNKSINDERLNEEQSREFGDQRAPSELRRASRYYFAFTIGNNLPELLKLEIVNPKFTVSNNVHHILASFGIEAARNYLIKEFLAVISADGASVNIQHILILVDYMTRIGSITKINPQTVATRGYGTLTKMTTSNALKTLLLAGAFGKRETKATEEVSAAIMVGKLANIGTAYGNYPEYTKALEELIEDERTGRKFILDPEETEQAIEELSAANEGLTSNSAEDERGRLTITPDYSGPITQLTDEIPASDKSLVTNVIPPSHTISNHLANVLSQITHVPCQPQMSEVVHIQPHIASSLETTSLPIIPEFAGAFVETLPEVQFKLLLPHPTSNLALPQTLIEELDAASRISLPTVVSKESQLIPSLAKLAEPHRPSRKPMPKLAPLTTRAKPQPIITPTTTQSVITPTISITSESKPLAPVQLAPLAKVAPRAPIELPPVDIAGQLTAEGAKLVTRPGMVPQPIVQLPGRGIEPTSKIGGFTQVLFQ